MLALAYFEAKTKLKIKESKLFIKTCVLIKLRAVNKYINIFRGGKGLVVALLQHCTNSK